MKNKPVLKKTELYEFTLTQIKGLLEGESNFTANLANIAAVLKENHDFFWVGFYLVESEELILGPFQGPVACTRIQYGKGVCGTSWKNNKMINVPNVHEFPGHIACNDQSLSEIVIPVQNMNGSVIGVLDIDSKELKSFDSIDEEYLQKLVLIITEKHG